MVALDVLRWRAGIYDFLSDIWDVIGEPMLDMFECNAMAAFLVPVGARRCIFCLAAEPNHHPCVVLAHVRSKWPTLPGFERPDA